MLARQKRPCLSLAAPFSNYFELYDMFQENDGVLTIAPFLNGRPTSYQ